VLTSAAHLLQQLLPLALLQVQLQSAQLTDRAAAVGSWSAFVCWCCRGWPALSRLLCLLRQHHKKIRTIGESQLLLALIQGERFLQPEAMLQLAQLTAVPMPQVSKPLLPTCKHCLKHFIYLVIAQ
jgi:hypothetical protein